MRKYYIYQFGRWIEIPKDKIRVFTAVKFIIK